MDGKGKILDLMVMSCLVWAGLHMLLTEGLPWSWHLLLTALLVEGLLHLSPYCYFWCLFGGGAAFLETTLHWTLTRGLALEKLRDKMF